MVTRLFASKSSSSGSSQKSLPQQPPPPPPPASHKPKSPYSPTVGKPPRKRPTNLPLSHSSQQNATNRPSPTQPSTTQYPQQHHSSSRTPPGTTFRPGQPTYLRQPFQSRHNQAHVLPNQVTHLTQNRKDPHDAQGSSFTYTSFAEPGPTFNYMDLTRTRSDESLLWTAEEEASALVAELRASLNCNNNTNSDNSINCVGRYNSGTVSPVDSSSHRGLNPYQFRRESVQNEEDNQPRSGVRHRTSNACMLPEGEIVRSDRHNNIAEPSGGHPNLYVPQNNPFQRSFSVHRRSSDAKIAAQKLNHVPPLRSHSFTDIQSAVELMPLHSRSAESTDSSNLPSPIGGSSLGGSSGLSVSGSINGCSETMQAHQSVGCGPHLKTFGGSWKSLLRVGAMSGRNANKPPGVGVKKVAPPTVPGHHLTHIQHLQHPHNPQSDPPTPSHTPTHTPTHTSHMPHQPQQASAVPQGGPGQSVHSNTNTAPDTPTSSTSSSNGSSSNGSNSNYRHSGSSFHSSSTASSGVFSGGDQRASFSSSIGSSEDAVSTNSSNPPPSPCSPSSGTSSLDSRGGVGRLNSMASSSSSSTTATGGASPSHYSAGTTGAQFTFPPPAPSTAHAGAPQFAHLLCKSGTPNSPQHQHSNSPHGAHNSTAQQHGTPEDQGIDVQSPVRSGSPGSGSGSSSTGSTASTNCCRNSTTSLDSGRASTHHHHHHPHHQHRLSGQSYDSGSGGNGSIRHSYHSSSSSIGSIESPHLNVNDLLNNGVRDCEVLRAWLTELHLEEHTEKFLSAGYDLPTISRITPEDLNAIGITKPAHRKKLKQEIGRLNISDGLPDYIPAKLEEWLSLLRLSEYNNTLQLQGYITPVQMLQVMWEDLEEMGITRLGHQKKVVLAIKRIKDIKGGKKFSSSLPPPPQQEIMVITRDSQPDNFPSMSDFRTFSGQRQGDQPYSNRPNETYNQRTANENYAQGNNGNYNSAGGGNMPGAGNYNPNGAQFSPSVYRSYAGNHGVMPGSPLHRQNSQHGSHNNDSNSSASINANNSISNQQQHSQQHHKLYSAHNNQIVNMPSHTGVHYRPDFVTVQVHPQIRRTKDGVFEEPIYSTFHPDNNRFSQYQQQTPQQQQMQLQQQSNQFSSLPPRPNLPPLTNSYPPRSLDDGDITPTNEMITYEGGGTLPRHRASNNKFRPVAKVTAKTRAEVHHEMNEKNTSTGSADSKEFQENSVTDCSIKQNNNVSNANKIENIYNIIHAHSTNNTPQGTPKKLPPPPPRRSNSISETSKLESLNGSNLKSHGTQHAAVPASLASNLSGSNSIQNSASGSQNREGHYGFLRRGMNYGYMGVKNNLQPDIASDLPPPPPAPHDVGNHQHILHHHSHRRPQTQMLPDDNEQMNSNDNTEPTKQVVSSNVTQTSKGEAFPSPPSALSLTSSSSATSVTPLVTSSELEETVNMRPRRNDSTVSNCSHKSTSSTDSSDSIPFANDNAGTIKQRYNNAPPAVPPHTSIPAHLHAASPHASPVPSPASLRRTTPHRVSLHKPGVSITPVRSASTAGIAAGDDSNDVLSDIGNMLANLTDELDAMLEQEMAA
uniref:Caskin-2 n=1 Tax=Hirondellea gigas TaxID=1518452 RepID=A0A6A7FQR2_9CRUS